MGVELYQWDISKFRRLGFPWKYTLKIWAAQKKEGHSVKRSALQADK